MKLTLRRENVFVGGDYSQQEPRLLAHMSKDPNLIKVYEDGKDLYASIGTLIFKKDYWECMEVWEDGSANDDGKAIRNQCKSIVLGIMYGMGAGLLSTLLGVTKEECLTILENFYKSFPYIKQFTLNNKKMAEDLGYVEDYLGRRRNLPDINLPELVVNATTPQVVKQVFFDGLEKSIKLKDLNESERWETTYNESYKNKGFKRKEAFKKMLKDLDIEVKDNGGFISKTLTQCTNARIQGSAASLTKKAMVDLDNCEELKDLKFNLLVPVHDELMGECPIRCIDKVSELLSKIMIESSKDDCSVKMKVDTYAVKYWNADQFRNSVENKYSKLLNDKGLAHEEAFDKIKKEYVEIKEESLLKMCLGTFDLIYDEI